MVGVGIRRFKGVMQRKRRGTLIHTAILLGTCIPTSVFIPTVIPSHCTHKMSSRRSGMPAGSPSTLQYY